MQQSQRADWNHALEYAALQAGRLGKPLLVLFVLTPYAGAGRRHYVFMLQGLIETARTLEERGIAFVLRTGDPVREVIRLARNAAFAVFDRGYLRNQRAWRREILEGTRVPAAVVESDAVVPVQAASDKEEYNAAALRRKLAPLLTGFLVPPERAEISLSPLAHLPSGEDFSDSGRLLRKLGISGSVRESSWYHGGCSAARKRLDLFVRDKLDRLEQYRSDPGPDYQSHLSPYIHFGQISPLEIALAVKNSGSPGKDLFLEQLIVRRELSLNHVWYNPAYDRFDGLPEWARKTLKYHEGDRREYIYSREEWEAGRTHDVYWNAAQKELAERGSIHGYMRMYWGKKILEWSASPEEAFETALYLNDKYALDGRDPNGYTGAAWCFGRHDRPWPERPVYGNIRYMNHRGLERKFRMNEYLERVNSPSGLSLF